MSLITMRDAMVGPFKTERDLRFTLRLARAHRSYYRRLSRAIHDDPAGVGDHDLVVLLDWFHRFEDKIIISYVVSAIPLARAEYKRRQERCHL